MKIIDRKGKTVLIINAETYEIEKSNDPEFEITWNDWLKNGKTTLGPPEGIDDDTILADGEYRYNIQEARGLLGVDLGQLGLELVE